MKYNQCRKKMSIIMLLLIFALLFSIAEVPAQAASVKAPAKVTNFKSSTRGTTSIKLVWKKVPKANGYRVYRKTPGAKKWKRIAAVKSTKKSYISTGLKENKRYQYRVRAYRTYKLKGKTKYKFGKYSKIITVRTKKVLKTMILKGGYYTAGVDIPAGVFDVNAIAGVGYILAEIDSANLRGPEYKKNDFYDFNDYSRTFRNFRMPTRDILEVSDVQVRINYSKITKNAKGRKYDKSSSIKLTPGNYTVGRDIDAGRYCIKHVSGGGCIISSRSSGDCIVGCNMDGDPKTGDYTDYISNVLLKNREVIEVSSGLTVLFIPEI